MDTLRGRKYHQRLRGGSRHDHLTRRYGIGAVDVEAMIEVQGRRCPICVRPDPEQVDHDHVTGQVRGVLCCNCNGGLGQLRDDVDALLAAVAYLTRTDGLDGATLDRAWGLVQASG
ncbi:MAG TPA: endonuclease VII domain-containing protein [Acidimicrobiia bacterium]|nr:endonuclease VII domain-containing protein [Acidimicrobiia bacterium]